MALKAGGPPPPVTAHELEGGPNPPELGDTATTIVMLDHGNYAMLCFVPGRDGIPHIAKGMVRPLTVTPGPGAKAAEPAADVVMKLTDYKTELSKPLTAGQHIRAINSNITQEREVVVAANWDAGKQPMNFALGRRGRGRAARDAAWGMERDHAGGRGLPWEVDLEAGEYGLICFLCRTSKDGKRTLRGSGWRRR